ncbi:MAG: phosphoglycerate dehydrogenase [Myxococcales bacterium]|nr:phosphoglycerate dehydrogenase [Myxococcales bacterium]
MACGIVRAVSRAHVLLLENIHVSAHEEFRRSEITVHTHGGGMTDTRLIQALQALPGDAPLMVGIRSKTRVTAAVFEAVPRLVALGAFCIGTDQIDLEAARRAGVVVFNAPFSNTRSVAELVLGEIIMLSRQIFPRSMACHRGEWRKSATGSHEVRGKTVGIVGYGHIGSQLSVLAESLGLTVLYYDIISKLPLGNAHPVDSLEALLEASDFVTLHVPDTEFTRGMIGASEIRCMRKGAYLVNASRGQVVDIPALRAALDDGHLAGAAIDVYPKEPKSLSEPFVSELRGVESVILSPHIGGSTEEAQANIGREVGSALSSYLLHGATIGSVNIPNLEAPPIDGGCRIVNLHRNVPGVLSAVNRVVAESEVNVTGQRLGTLADVGLLIVDLAIDSSDPRARAVSEAIAALPTSLRTRIL